VDVHLQGLGRTSALTSLALRDCPGLEGGALAQLRQLDLLGSFAKADGEQLGGLARLPRLRSLCVAPSSAFVGAGGGGAPAVLRALTGLTRLDVSGGDGVDAAAMGAIGRLTGLLVSGGRALGWGRPCAAAGRRASCTLRVQWARSLGLGLHSSLCCMPQYCTMVPPPHRLCNKPDE
jgi:hypothetical protein